MISKIRIVGSPGSGKTYLAEQLSKILDIPSIKLDDFFYDMQAKVRDKPGPVAKRDAKLKAVLKKNHWILEGHWDDWSRVSFEQANLVVVLRPNTFKRKFRIFQRHLKRRFGIIKGRKETLKDLLHLLDWSAKYEKSTLPNMISFLKKNELPFKVFPSADKALVHFTSEQSTVSKKKRKN